MQKWDLDTSAAQVRDAMDELQAAWQQTAEQWSDTVSDRFRETHLEPLGPEIKKSLDAVGQMQQLVDQIHRDCES